MTEMKKQTQSLLERAIISCGEFEYEALDLLEAMYSDEEDNNPGIADPRALRPVVSKHTDLREYEPAAVYKYSTFNLFLKSFLESISNSVLGNRLEPGSIRDLINDLRDTEVDDHFCKFNLYGTIQGGHIEGCEIWTEIFEWPRSKYLLDDNTNRSDHLVVSSFGSNTLVCFRIETTKRASTSEKQTRRSKWSIERVEFDSDDDSHSSIIARGPCHYNPNNIRIGTDLGLLSMLSKQIEN